MTPRERRDPKVLNASRRRRIAAGSGTSVQEVNRLVKQFGEAQKMMRQVMKVAGVGGPGGKKKGGARAQAAQAKALRQLQQSGQIQLPGGGGLGGFPGLQPSPKRRKG